ncbi:YggS family pyridoxal phosphate-dependent enzyme [Patulibacter sp. SYSU D01012]|uniref:YggS family pyridoxal phosphate-dependent enzyme n=1 Tax=Patulibacter sp. SYSU D01012 TaxID=2817381 RepID=UPI001B306673
MVELIERIDPRAVATRLEEVRGRIAAACARADRDPAEVDVLVATKYLVADQVPLLADAGVRIAGENRVQSLVEKVALPGAERLRWEFIGHLQSRKVPDVLPHVSRIHSVCSDSVLARLERHRDLARPELDVLIEVNVSGEDAKSGIAPDALDDVIARCPVPVAGLMTMPPAASTPEDSRRWFAMLRDLAAVRDLRVLSMGTTQDFEVAVEEGATVVRLGSVLLR